MAALRGLTSAQRCPVLATWLLLLLGASLLALPLPGTLGQPVDIGELSNAAIPASEQQQRIRAELGGPAAEAGLLGAVGALKSGGGAGLGGSVGSSLGGASGNVGDTSSSLGGTSSSPGDTGGSLGGGATTSLGSSPVSAAGVTPPAVGGTEYDLTGALFNGNAQAFTQAVLASGTQSAAIAVAGMLQLPEMSIRTLAESLAGPEPGASAVARAVTGGFQMSACQSPELAQDATAMAISGGGPLAAAAARGLARAAQGCCSKVARHLAGASMSLDASTSFVRDLEAALQATNSVLPACAVPDELVG